jgi:uncharacterized membrane protein
MLRQLTAYTVALNVVLAISSRAMAQEPAFVAIQPPDGDGTATFAFDISNRGDIVGAYNAAPDGHRYGFLRTADGRFTRINVPGSFRTHADGITSRGDIVGWYAPGPGENHGFLLKNTGQLIRIDVPGAVVTRAIGINERGNIVGFYCLLPPASTCGSQNNSAHGFLLRDGVLSTIDVPGALQTEAYKINGARQILGRYVTTGGTSHLFLMSEDDFTTIDAPDALQTGIDGANAGLNSHGDVVGDYCPAAPCDVFFEHTVHGFLLTEDGNNFRRIDVRGAAGTSAYGINARGDIVGVAQIDATHAVGFLRVVRERAGDEDNERDDQTHRDDDHSNR